MKHLRIALALCAAGVFPAGAVAFTASSMKPAATRAPIVLAAQGCGRGYFRTIAGNCEPNARLPVGRNRSVVLPPPCPRGYARDPDPARPLCYPVF